jgi:hypothetical protein
MINIRIDDYPFCLPNQDPDQAEVWLREMFEVLSRWPAHYYFGAIPYHCDTRWIALADECMRDNGHLVMHGFTHRHDYDGFDRDLQPGGEFEGMTMTEARLRYLASFDVLKTSARFDRDHFIAPFNRYNENLLAAIDTKYIHTCDKEYNALGYAALNHYGAKPIIGNLYKDYGFASRVLKYINTPGTVRPEWVTLHWYYEFRHFGSGWLKDLNALCKECSRE